MILFIRSSGYGDSSELMIEEINPQSLPKNYTPEFKERLTEWIDNVTETVYNADDGSRIEYGQTLRVEDQEGFYVHINNDACTNLFTPKTVTLASNVEQFIKPTIPIKKKKR